MVQLWFSKHSGVSGKVYLSDRVGGLHLVQLRCRLCGSVAWGSALVWRWFQSVGADWCDQVRYGFSFGAVLVQRCVA